MALATTVKQGVYYLSQRYSRYRKERLMFSKENRKLIEDMVYGLYRYHPYTNYTLLVTKTHIKPTKWMVKPIQTLNKRSKVFHDPIKPIYFKNVIKALLFALQFREIAKIKYDKQYQY